MENRTELQNELIEHIIEGMDISDLCMIVGEYLDREYDEYTDEQLVETVKEYAPHLLDDGE